MSTHQHSSDQHASDPQVKRRGHHEGPRNHVISFIISIVLTILAFIAVAYGEQLNPAFIVPFILILAVFQVVIQLFFWMHLKDRGHLYPTMFLFTGAFVALTAAIAALYWMWW
jgi:cytochrome c oxidase subunit 4